MNDWSPQLSVMGLNIVHTRVPEPLNWKCLRREMATKCHAARNHF